MIATKREPGGLHIFLFSAQAVALLVMGVAWIALLLWTHGVYYQVALFGWVGQGLPWFATVVYAIWRYDT